MQAAQNAVLRRVPPQDLEAERAVLGACMAHGASLVESARELLKPDHFYSPPHRLVYEAALALAAEGQAVDMITMSDRMRILGTLDQAGGVPFIADLCESVVSRNIQRYAKIIIEKARRRALIDIAADLIETAFDPTADLNEFAGRAQGVVDAVLEDRVNVGDQRPSVVADEAVDHLERLASDVDSGAIVKTPFYGLNQLTGGVLPGEVVVVAGRPGTGKTAFALNWVRYACKKGWGCGVFSLEMQTRFLALRMFAQFGVDAQRFRDGKLTKQDWMTVHEGAYWLGQQDDRLRFWDRPGLTASEFRAQVRKWRREIDLRLVMVDYLQLLRPDQRGGSREQEVAEVSRTLAETAREHGVGVLCLAQLNRDAEKSSRPLLSHLRESGAVEQDADQILFIVPWDARGTENRVELEVDVAKGRGNRTGTTKLWFDRSRLLFVNPEYQRQGEGL
ncbi:MAG: replicative DNA helicase [Desulfovibrionaceae bacterium]